ncbi:MAG: hypothetical protein HY892_11610 [Deltaproteobacteria bacterium]|nr:hypothetical protein [Deltaproteobacteria bacterium]
MERADANWWFFAIEKEKRGGKIRNDPSAGTVEINPPVGGRRILSYHSYLKLDRLLSSQTPSSTTPDERIFIVTHQLFELVFKQTLFDLGVVARTLNALLDRDRSALADLTGFGRDQGTFPGRADFWGPALTASARIKHSWIRVIPAVMTYLAMEDTFDNQEFEQAFRDNLAPASGFQSAQFRLIQRAFGKSPLLGIRLFPADSYFKEYLGMTEPEIVRKRLEPGNGGLVNVADPLILQEGVATASPVSDSPLFPVGELDDLAHEVLARIDTLEQAGTAGDKAASPVPFLPEDEEAIKAMEGTFREGIKGVLEKIKRKKGEPLALGPDELEMVKIRAEVFGKDWSQAVQRENRRRRAFEAACRGARLLLRNNGEKGLGVILENLVQADNALTGGFLFFHRNMVERRIGGVPGTAGGGVPFLDLSKMLTDKFPALIAFRTAREETRPQQPVDGDL